MSGTVTLWADVPLNIEVDLDTGEVVRVVVIDEAPDVAHATIEGNDQPADVLARAKAIADEAEWPAWQFGY